MTTASVSAPLALAASARKMTADDLALFGMKASFLLLASGLALFALAQPGFPLESVLGSANCAM